MNKNFANEMTRRTLFSKSSMGIGTAALATLLGNDQSKASEQSKANDQSKTSATQLGLSDLPHHPPKARNVIYLLMNGGPPHIDMFDYKPELEKYRGKEIPESVHRNQRVSTMTQGAAKLALPAFTGFKQHGESGAWVCDFLPHTAGIVDDLCFVKSMHTTSVNHAPAITFFLTGSEMPGRPSMGAWATYGLGSESQDLPGFVVMTSRDKEATCGQIFYDFYWGSGFLPSKYQGVKFRGGGDPVLYLSNPNGLTREVRRELLDDLAILNQRHFEEMQDPEIATRIAQYEMAYRMQASVPEITDLTRELENVLEMYGPDVKRPGSFAYNCLMARKLVERGVRFVQLFHAGWDHFMQRFVRESNSIFVLTKNACSRNTYKPLPPVIAEGIEPSISCVSCRCLSRWTTRSSNKVVETGVEPAKSLGSRPSRFSGLRTQPI